MLRSFSTAGQFRGLHLEPFGLGDSACSLGRRTVIYGRNGAGKTSLSELLRLEAGGRLVEGAPVKASLSMAGLTLNKIAGASTLPFEVMVYNRFYVAESLALFLDGSGTSDAILKLGRVNIEAANQLRLAREVDARLLAWTELATAAKKQAITAIGAAENRTKTETIALLSAGDPGRYGTSTYRVDHVRLQFKNVVESSSLDDEAIAVEIAAASAEERASVEVGSTFPAVDKSLANQVFAALTRVVDSVPVPDLRTDRARETWTETGIGLHAKGDECLFCRNGKLTSDVLDAYRRHFSDALTSLRDELYTLMEKIEGEIDACTTWFAELPDQSRLLIDYRSTYTAATDALSVPREAFLAERSAALMLVRKRLADPLSALDSKEISVSLKSKVDSSEVLSVLTRNFEAYSNQAARKRTAQSAVEAHVASLHVNTYHAANKKSEAAQRCLAALTRRRTAVREDIATIEKSQHDTGLMAARIDSDLRTHFGHDHLSISVSGDGKGYLIQRDGAPASSLSEGERNAIAFSYFLASLEAEGKDPSKTLVVVDDPVTSMDKESLFAAFALAETRTEKMAQTIFLTHDYEYFRLQVRQRKNALEKSQKKIATGDAQEAAFPAVAILEMFARTVPGGGRISQLRRLSSQLLRQPSEYHYLFARIANAVAHDETDELPLLGNAARRLIEGFISFRAPHGENFQARIDAIAQVSSIPPAMSNRVVKFLHGQSHREDPNPASALDFPSVGLELRAALGFMRLADPSHFANMCQAVGIEEKLLVSSF